MRKNTYLIWFLFICAIGFGVISIMMTTQLISGFDNTISVFIQGNQSTLVTKVSKALALIGGPKMEAIVAVILIIPVLLFHRKYKMNKAGLTVSNLALFATVNVITYFSNSIVKHFFHRHRPMPHMGGYSFPSDHAMMAFAFYITAAYLLWENISSRMGRILLATSCITMTILISLSRIYLNRHYPSDIIAGFFVSGFILSSVILLWGKLERRYKLNKLN